MIRVVFSMFILSTVLAGCNQRDDTILFDGQAFRGKASHVDRNNRRSFTATVSPVSASIDGAREAGRFEGTKYCVNEYGTSDIIWDASPDAEPQTWSVDRDSVTFSGTCDP